MHVDDGLLDIFRPNAPGDANSARSEPTDSIAAWVR